MSNRFILPALVAWGTFAVPRLALAVPTLSATLSPDGRFSLSIVPDVAWTSAEVDVHGTVSSLGPAAAGQEVVVEGVAETATLFDVQVDAVLGPDHGQHWELTVEPELVPLEPDVGDDDARPSRRGWSWLPWR